MPTRLKLFNTLSMRVEPFESLVPDRVNLFVCGPTIQDAIHVGHARTYIFYDVLARYLSYLGNEVNFLLNMTDIDESIVRGARARRQTVKEFLLTNELAFRKDLAGLGVSTVTSIEAVSKYVPEMIEQVSSLIGNGHAYATDQGVFFDVTTFPDFGKLSHQTMDEIALRPLEISPKKRNQFDFSLWRSTSRNEQRWQSPWGRGTPGWHIQDTAVTAVIFGHQYDIHGGARELIYPHHEAEIAQSESLSGIKPFVRYWVHTGLLTMDGEKMSKSHGNVYYVRDLLDRYDINAIRLYLAGIHHRADEEFDEAVLKATERKFLAMRSRVEAIREKSVPSQDLSPLRPFLAALDADMNVGLAIRSLYSMIGEGARRKDPEVIGSLYNSVVAASKILGIDFSSRA